MMTLLSLFLFAATAAAQSPQPEWQTLPASGVAPSARVDGALAYHPPSRTLYMFGGRAGSPRNDLWSYSLASQQWIELRPSGPLPPARFGHTLVLDSRRNRLIVFGGQAGGFFSDTWAFDLATGAWRQLAADNAGPSRRYGHSGVYDAARDRVIISHGFTDAGRFDDTWAFDLAANRWQDLSPSGTRPLRRCLHHAVIDSAGGQMYLYGGCSSGFGPCPQDDLWSFDLTTQRWTELRPTPKPQGRQWYGAGFDTDRRRLLIFGGSGNLGNLNDSWEFDPAAATWTKLDTAAAPSARERQEGVYVPSTGFYFFGGATDRGLTNDLLLLPTTPPLLNPLSLRVTPLVPGGLVNVPADPAATSIRMNGITAPLIAVRDASVTVQVPYELAGSTTATILVELPAASPQTREAKVADIYPGIPEQLTISAAGTLRIPITGVGPLIPAVATGAADPTAAVQPAATITVQVDGEEIPITAIRHTETPGLLEIEIAIAEGPTRQLVVLVNGLATQPSTLSGSL